jgi:hypothetical protein
MSEMEETSATLEQRITDLLRTFCDIPTQNKDANITPPHGAPTPLLQGELQKLNVLARKHLRLHSSFQPI